MTAILAPPLRFRGVDNNGLALISGLLSSFIAGTSTPQATYVDSTQATQNTNPIILDSRGECNLWLDPTKVYKFTLTDQFGNPIGTTDQVQGSLTAAALTVLLPSLLTPIITQAYLGAILTPQTPTEAAAAVTPVNIWIAPGNILRYGTNTTPGTTDMTTAITAAIAQALVGGAPVYVPPGIFLYTSQINKTLGAGNVSLSIIGAGANATELRCSAASGGFGFSWTTEDNSVHIRDIAFTTTQVNGGTALTLFYGGAFGSIDTMSDIQNCVFRGSDGYNVANYWSNAIVQNVVSALNIDNCTIVGQGTFAAGGNNCHGTGVVLESSTGAAAPAVLTNITRCDFQNLHVGVNYLAFYQGLSVVATNFVSCDIGINQSANQVSDAELNVVASQFACNFNILLQSGIVGTTINSNYFISTFAGDVSILIAGEYDFTITSNYFQALSTAANITAVSINTVPLTFSPAPSTGATAGTYAAPLVYSAGQAYSIVTSTGQSLRVFFTGLGNANLTWFPAITGSPTTAATITGGVGVIQGNVIDNYSVGINLNPNTSGVLVTANVFNTPGATLIANQGPAAVAAFLVPNSVTNNPGFLTRNEGVTGAIATGTTVAHGLAVTPTIVLLQAQDGTPTAVFPSAIGATFFTVNYTGGGTHAFAWQASIANVG